MSFYRCITHDFSIGIPILVRERKIREDVQKYGNHQDNGRRTTEIPTGG